MGGNGGILSLGSGKGVEGVDRASARGFFSKHTEYTEWKWHFLAYTVKNAVELFFAFHPDVEKIQYH